MEQSSEAFSGDAASDSSAPQSSGQAQGPKEPLKLGTTVFEHATARNPGPASPTGINSPSAGAGLGTGIGAGAGQSGSIAGGPGTSAGQAAPPLVLGTTVFEHALSRTSGNPLGRTSGTPSSPRTSFKGPSAGATEPTSAGLQGSLHTTLQGSAACTCGLLLLGFWYCNVSQISSILIQHSQLALQMLHSCFQVKWHAHSALLPCMMVHCIARPMDCTLQLSRQSKSAKIQCNYMLAFATGQSCTSCCLHIDIHNSIHS